MTYELSILAITAASIGFIHVVFGPDHYLPFIMIARARNWSLFKTTWITFLCGIGHVCGSVLIGCIGITFGVTITKLMGLESIRGNLAAWFLVTFGLTYFIWGLHRALKNKPHKHLHIHGNVTGHTHEHKHKIEHSHVHNGNNITPWILFIIFVFGPCEPLIPLLMYPAATSSIAGVVLVTVIFSLVSITTMLSIVIVSTLSTNIIQLGRFERYTDAIAGLTICLCGLGIQLLGL